MGKRSFGQYCGLAHALELVGERWGLLVVRDLIPGPKRFTDLQRGLQRIPTNVLSNRLKELEASGVIARRVLPPPSRAVVYELTGYGRELEPVLRALMAWGSKSLGDPGEDDVVNPSSLLIGLQLAFDPAAARGVRASFEIRLPDAVVHLEVDDGRLLAEEGPAAEPDLVIESDLRLRYLMTGEVDADAARRSGIVRLTGDEDLFEPFASVFRFGASTEEEAEAPPRSR